MVSPVYIKPLLAILVIAAIVAIVAVVLRNDSTGPVPAKPVNQQLPHNIDIALKRAVFSEIKNGLVLWELVADRVDYDKNGDTAYLTNIRMNFKKTVSRGAVTVTADNGVYSTMAKNIKMKGNVHIVNEEGADFKTASLDYNGVVSKFSTNDSVIFRQERLQLNAVGMDLSVDDQRAHFHSSINSSIVMN